MPRRNLLVGAGALVVVALVFAGLFATGILDSDGTDPAAALEGDTTETTDDGDPTQGTDGASGAVADTTTSTTDDPQLFVGGSTSTVANGSGETTSTTRATTSSSTTTTTRATTTTTRATTTTTAAPTTTAPPTTTTTSPPAIGPPSCNGTSCITITGIFVEGGNLRITWSPSDFSPSNSGTHAHFYWDIYSASQVGTNAASFGVSQAPWELTSNTNFVPSGQVRLSNKPAAADRVCVTTANGSHGVIDPANFHCVFIPSA